MKVDICGIPHTVIETENVFDTTLNFGMISFQNCEIKINKDMPNELKSVTLCHEILHGILTHLGYYDKSDDEQFVQSMAQAINQSFTVKGYD